ncbi:acyl carrier protein [Paenibacillus xylaniclasticus]|uniref:acyl carrier protein n=1 Tax=Paenibacillus xylaniclasticus TaxID=588083 RepID=UPI0013DF44B7|nr:acyl carrier protein [Paenibacillus xylaniclasticus]GFN32187.1 hypothetical protein PCURB6_24470 [Paenibacillus curdlanolyticus]
MSISTIQEKVEAIIKETLKHTGQLEEHTSLLSRIHLDSMSFMTIVLRLENEFGFEFGEEQLIIDNFQNIASLVTYVQNRLGSLGIGD